MLNSKTGRRPPSFPEWLNPEFCNRAGLRERWETFNIAYETSTPRGRPFWDYATPYVAQLFDVFDAGWTGVPVEFRHPLMDVRLVTFLLNLPAVPWCVQKELFRQLRLKSRVPPAVYRRPKTTG